MRIPIKQNRVPVSIKRKRVSNPYNYHLQKGLSRAFFVFLPMTKNKTGCQLYLHYVNMKKIAVAITGASGSIYAKLLLQKLTGMKEQVAELSVVMSENAKQVWQTELEDESYTGFEARYFTTTDFTAPFASGSAQYDALIIAPCSMGTLGRIAAGISNDLITRGADVMLKERKKLILLIRDTPYNLVHIRNMETVTLAGGIICPASPSFYSKPDPLEKAAATVVDRALDLAGLKLQSYRWGNKEP
jgi:flavin prenyltransferase